jgi:mRNA interferase MazF
VEVKRGDVVVMVAHEDLGRPRPGVIVQTDAIGDTTSTLLICPLTTELTDNPRIRPTVEPSTANGLRLRSQFMTDKVSSVRRNRIKAVIGTLDTETSERLDRALLVVLGLAR